jgi:predicted permease
MPERASRFRRALIRAALLTWPERLRERNGYDIAQIHHARVTDVLHSRGRIASVVAGLTDLVGIATAGMRARRSARLIRHNEPQYMRELPRMETLLQDIRYAFKSMRRRPGTPVLALLTVALGIGAATAMYSVVDGVLLRPLPFEGAERLMSVYPTIEEWRTNPVLSAYAEEGAFSYPEFVAWEAQQKSFDRVAAIGSNTMTLLGNGDPARVRISMGTIGLFPMLHVEPVLGRLFVAEDFRPDGTPVVLTYELWRTRFGGARDIIGKSIDLGGKPRTVIGVLPAKFAELGLPGEVWTMIGGPANEKERLNHSLRAMASLKPGVTRERAIAETASILQGQSRIGGHDITHHANVLPRLDDQTKKVRGPLMLLLGATSILLLAACINVAGLLLGAGIDRSAELAVRSALGAARTRLTRQLMTESLLLAFVGGVVGIIAAFGIKKVLLLMAPPDLPRIGTVHIDVRVLAFAALCTVAVGTVFGIVPAVSLSKTRLTDRMGSARVTSSSRARLHSSLVTVQLALAMVLLGGAGLLVHTLNALNNVDVGFDSRNLLAIDVSPQYSLFAKKTPQEIQNYYDEFKAALVRTQGVEAVALTTFLPFSGMMATNSIEPEGYTPAKGELIDVTREYVSGNFFDMMHMRLIDGRAITDSDDRIGAPAVSVVGERFAKHFWPGQKAIGKHFVHWGTRFTVIGVVADAKDMSLEETEAMRFYMPINSQDQVLGASFLIRTKGDPAAITPDARNAIWSVDRNLPITRSESMESMIAASIAAQRYRARLITTFAALALMFSLLGVYGVVNRAVSGRMREMGLRLALGARPRSLVMMILTQGIRLSVFGAVFGLIALSGVTRLLTTFLFGTKPLDPVALGSVALILIALAALAVLPPSLRAARAVALNSLRLPD